MSENSEDNRTSSPCWIVLTPSVDDRVWRAEIMRAADEAGLAVVHPSEDAVSPIEAIRLTNDADLALTAGAARIVALIPEPATAPEAVGDQMAMETPHKEWHASMLLSRALALAPLHPVITAEDLRRRPAALTLFGTLRLIPPRSGAEIPRDPALAAAFDIYASLQPGQDDPVVWSETLFSYDDRSLRGSPGPGILDTTGRPRMMASGPYFYMPPGNWRACLRFAVDAGAAKRQYRLDWGTRTACVSEYVTPGAAGIYELELDFIWSHIDVAEIRLILTEGCFMGTLMFQGVTVRKIADRVVAEERAVA